MKKAVIVFSLLIALFPAKAWPLTVPERLGYDLTLAGVKVGELSLEAARSGSQVRLSSRVASVPWVSLFYRVEDTGESHVAGETLHGDSLVPQTYRVTVHEGSHKVEKEYIFDHMKKRVNYRDRISGKRSFFGLGGQTLDPLSGLYHLRGVPLVPGKSVFIRVFNNKFIYRVEVQVLRKERVKTPLGSFDTLLLRSNMDSVGDGIVYNPGDLYLWLTDDDRRTPVMIEKRLNELVEGKMPSFLKGRIPGYFREKLSAGAVKAVIVKKE